MDSILSDTSVTLPVNILNSAVLPGAWVLAAGEVSFVVSVCVTVPAAFCAGFYDFPQADNITAVQTANAIIKVLFIKHPLFYVCHFLVYRI